MNSEPLNLDKSRKRISIKERFTKETEVRVSVNIDGSGNVEIKTGIPFINHLISTFGKHSMVDIYLEAKSNDNIAHHLIEDVAITLSQTLNEALSNRTQIRRYGYAIIPMDEVMAISAIDLIKRQFHKVNLGLTREEIEGIAREDLEHFIESLLQNLNACTHINIQYGENDHHKIEAAVKSFAISFRMASDIDQRNDIPSTKGVM
ncbi:MAG TPA: imidazoleglycerol-phosphate dehydratase [Nitrososphaeraceae archaeon]|nr:imidazoleglycerol-phosphate dehydratase [Nitrososphaeraceae archaeon]